MRAVPALVVIALLAAGCGEDDEVAATPAPPASRLADLRITYDPDGKGGRNPVTFPVRCSSPADAPACRKLEGLTAEDFAPVPDGVACTQIFGGAETAHIVGTLRGERVDARFSRENGCQISRWKRVAPLLEAA